MVHAVEMDPEIKTFKNTINNMTDQLQTFASEVSRVAREVGTEGRLGGQAKIDGVEGTWRELTDNGEYRWRFWTMDGSADIFQSTSWPAILPTKCVKLRMSLRPSPMAIFLARFM